MSHPQYSSYKDSEVEWLPEVPSHWDVAPLKALTSFVSRGDGPDYVDESPIRVINQACVQWIGLRLENVKYQAEVDISGWKGVLYPGDILINSTGTGTLGRVAFFQEYGVYIADGHVTIIRVDHTRMESRYIKYALTTPLYQGYIYSALVAGATNQIELSRERLRSTPIIHPPLAEQQAITVFLDHETVRIDGLIAKQEQMIALLQEKRKALISHAVAHGIDPDVPLKDSGVEWLGMVPEHWEVVRLKNLANVLRGKFTHRPRNDPAFYDGPYPFIQTGDISKAGKYIQEHVQTLNDRGLNVSQMFPANTLVMSIAANIGDVSILTFDACFPDSIVGFVPHHNIDLEYLYYLLDAMKKVLLSTSTLNTQMNLNIERIDTLKTICPPISEQRKIVAYIEQEASRVDNLIKKSQSAINLLKEHRSSLITAAVTGKIDVRGFTPGATNGQA